MKLKVGVMVWCDAYVGVFGGDEIEIVGRAREGHAPSVRYTMTEERALGTALYSTHS